MAAVLDDRELQRIYSWVDEIPLSRPKRSITRDFSDGVLMAELVHHYFPKLVESACPAPPAARLAPTPTPRRQRRGRRSARCRVRRRRRRRRRRRFRRRRCRCRCALARAHVLRSLLTAFAALSPSRARPPALSLARSLACARAQSTTTRARTRCGRRCTSAWAPASRNSRPRDAHRRLGVVLARAALPRATAGLAPRRVARDAAAHSPSLRCHAAPSAPLSPAPRCAAGAR